MLNILEFGLFYRTKYCILLNPTSFYSLQVDINTSILVIFDNIDNIKAFCIKFHTHLYKSYALMQLKLARKNIISDVYRIFYFVKSVRVIIKAVI